MAIPAYEAMGVVYAIFSPRRAYSSSSARRPCGVIFTGASCCRRCCIPVAGFLTGLVFSGGNLLFERLQAAGIVPGGTVGAIVEVLVVGLIGLAGFAGALILLRTFDEDEMEAYKRCCN